MNKKELVSSLSDSAGITKSLKEKGSVQFQPLMKKEYAMKPSELKRFTTLYESHLKLLKLQGKSNSTIDAYSRVVRRIRNPYDCCPDKLKYHGRNGAPFSGKT